MVGCHLVGRHLLKHRLGTEFSPPRFGRIAIVGKMEENGAWSSVLIDADRTDRRTFDHFECQT